MCCKIDPKRTFYDVALMLILSGVVFFAYGVAGGVYNYVIKQICVAFPAAKAIGGLIVMGIGYVVIELELLRKK